MSAPLTRRAFLAASAATAAASCLAPSLASDRGPEPLGPVAGRTGPRGIAAGSAGRPSLGAVTLLDGRVMEVSHRTAWRIRPGKSVLIAPEPDGTWSVLYAEC